MIFDTDVLISVERGNHRAAQRVEETAPRHILVQTYRELLQCAPNRRAQRVTRDFLRSFEFSTIPFSGNIGHRAAIYIEEYSLASGLRAGMRLLRRQQWRPGCRCLPRTVSTFMRSKTWICGCSSRSEPGT